MSCAVERLPVRGVARSSQIVHGVAADIVCWRLEASLLFGSSQSWHVHQPLLGPRGPLTHAQFWRRASHGNYNL